MTFPSILVIGANGFIGRWVARSIAGRGDDELSLGVRAPDGHSGNVVFCDMMDPDSLHHAMAGKQVVINCARAPSGMPQARSAMRNLVECAAASGVRRLIHLSSVAYYGGAAGLVKEDTAPLPPINDYGLEKAASEEICRRAAEAGLVVAVLRPSLVYGAGGEEWTGYFVRGLMTGHLKYLGARGEGDANLVYAGDLANFCVELAVRDLPPFTVLNVNGDEIPSFNRYFQMLNSALGLGELRERRTSAKFWESRRLARGVARRALKILPNPLARVPPMPYIGRLVQRGALDDPLDRYTGKVIYSNALSKDFGFRAETSLEEGVKRSVEWALSRL